MSLDNVYADAFRASSYAALEFPGTYYLAFRDVPALLGKHVVGTRALDFGCGAGRSTRFLRSLGFCVVGVDIAADMLAHARERDPDGDYREVGENGERIAQLQPVDVIFSAFTFDNVPALERKLTILRELAGRLAPGGKLVNLVSSPEIYVHEWASFTTREFPENRNARSGDSVKIVMTDVADRRPVIDVVCSDADYRELYDRAGLELLETHRPLGRPDEPQRWVSETTVAPWSLYVLGKR
ncbi:MAG: methyltransferase domain-containing protein [Planctomycetes bacterium]|nr:methyltransferase domain-containing protein [Planctomycetota bacterium]